MGDCRKLHFPFGLPVISRRICSFREKFRKIHRVGQPPWLEPTWLKLARIAQFPLPRSRPQRRETAPQNPQPRGPQAPGAPQARCGFWARGFASLRPAARQGKLGDSSQFQPRQLQPWRLADLMNNIAPAGRILRMLPGLSPDFAGSLRNSRHSQPP